MQSLVFVALAPLATLLMLVVGAIVWRRREAPGGWALVAFSACEIGWLGLDTLSVVSSSPVATIRFAQASLTFAALLGAAWLAFVLSYTRRMTPTARVVIWALSAWMVIYGGFALTNDTHSLVWSAWQTVADGPFLTVTYTLGPLAWAQSVFGWTLVLVLLGVLARAYTTADGQGLSRWIIAGALVPLAVNVLHAVGVESIEKDFTPLAMALSSAAFALGMIRYRLLDLLPIAREALVDNLTEGMLVLDLDGRVADANSAARLALGEGAVRLGYPLRDTLPALADAADAHAENVFRLGTGGAERVFDLLVSPLTDDAGIHAGRLILLHDSTRRRAERAELHRMNADLYDANVELNARNEELDAFAHTVAHDLKNSIHGVAGWAEILRDEGPDLAPDEHREIADGVVQAGHKMASIVHELLLLAGVRQMTVEPRAVDMASVVTEALARVRQTRALTVTGPATWPTALGHAPWLEEIWVNYLSNAAKYGGPTVTLGADLTAIGHLRFWVHDDGPGLPPESQRALFVPFSRVGEQEVEGHGLGLSIVRRIVEKLGGTCGVESRPDAGTRFWFALPSVEQASQPSAELQPSLVGLSSVGALSSA